MFQSRFVEIGSHHRSQIAIHARRRVELHASGLIESPLSIAERERQERLGLSGEFAVASVLGQKFEFVEIEGGEGDGGVDLRNNGISIDVKTQSARREGEPVRAFPAKYRARVIVFVRQSAAGRFDKFQILGWLLADDVSRIAARNEYVDICLCRLRSIDGGLPPEEYIYMRDPDLIEHCKECGRLL